MEAEILRLASFSDDQLLNEAGKKVLELDGMLGAVPPSDNELKEIGDDWWTETRNKLCGLINNNEVLRRAINDGGGVDPIAYAVSLVGILKPQLPGMHVTQLSITALLIVRHTIRDICID